MADEEHDYSKQADPNARVAKTIGEATFGGQRGTIVEVPDDEKADPSTVAHVQILDDQDGAS